VQSMGYSRKSGRFLANLEGEPPGGSPLWSSRLLKKGICHAERHCCSSLKTNKKQILRSAQDDMLGVFFSSLLVDRFQINVAVS